MKLIERDLDILHFQVFGSHNSQDVDVMVFVDSLKRDAATNHHYIKELNSYYEMTHFPGRKINCNLCTYDPAAGVIIDVFKGTPDEVNNSLYYTYKLHNQVWNNLIRRPVDRLVEYKFIRASRFFLSFFSRKPELRQEIKSALKSGDFQERLDALKKIDIMKCADYDFKFFKNERPEDVWKVIAFQLGITLELNKLKEVYTKDDLIEIYPDLKKPLYREHMRPSDYNTLAIMMNSFVKIAEAKSSSMEFRTEHEYDSKYKSN